MPPVNAAARTEFQGFIYPCGGAPIDERVTPGGVLHLLASNLNQWDTGNSLVDGEETNVARITIVLKSGRGVANITSTITPEGVDGTWELRYRVEVAGANPGGASGVGRGTGELRGMTLKFTAQSPVPRENSCNAAIPFAVPVSGVIHSPSL
jgi:hypothetical protein